MGHLGHLKTMYGPLAERLDAGPVGFPVPEDGKAREAWQEILEILYSSEHARIAARMPIRPARIETIAKRTGLGVEALRPKLDAMCDRGLVMDLVHPETGKVRYLLSPPVVGFFEFTMMRAHDMYPKERIARAMDGYVHGDPAFAREVFGEKTVIGRTLAHESVIAEETLPDVLSWEKARGIVEEAGSAAVSYCYCRHKAEHLGHACDAPKEICLSLNGGADFVIRREFGRRIERSEAIGILEKSREKGLVHIADNVEQRPAYICNCCGCCCGQLRAINDFDLPAVNPSGFQPDLLEDRCKGCSRCARACPVTAVTMVSLRREAQRKNGMQPAFDLDRCVGCGLCALACNTKALFMERREEQPAVPKNAIERSVRMAVERGRLPHLLFDQGEGRGSRFLNKVLSTLQRLPLSSRILASDQVRSRFIRATLSRVKDPTGGAG